MSKSLLRMLLLGGFCYGIFGASPAMAVVQPVTKPLYIWKTESEADPATKQFDHCLVKNMYDDGTAVILAQNTKGSKRLALHFAQPKMQPGQHFDLAIQVDDKDLFPSDAIAVNANIMTIGIPDSLPDQMRKGHLLHVRGPQEEMTYELSGMEGAVASLQDCMIAQNVRMNDKMNTQAPVIARTEDGPAVPPLVTATAKAPPVAATKPATAVSVKPPVTPSAPTPAIEESNKVIEVAKDLPPEMPMANHSGLLPAALQSIYADAGLSPDKLIPLHKQGKQEQPLDYLWQKDSLFVGFKQKPVAGNETIEKVSVNYLRMLRSRCHGNFLAESTIIQTTPTKGMTWQATEAACSSGTKGDSIAAILFATTPKGAQIFFFESGADQGAGAIKARDAVQAIVTKG